MYTAQRQDNEEDHRQTKGTMMTDSLRSFYDVDGIVGFIEDLGPKIARVAFQFPDELLHDAAALVGFVSASLSQRRETKETEVGGARDEDSSSLGDVLCFALADTQYGSCCVDEVAARHYNADCIIHVGFACLSRPPTTPTFFAFTQKSFDLSALVQALVTHSKANDDGSVVVVFYDVALTHQMESVRQGLRGLSSSVGTKFVVPYVRNSYKPRSSSSASSSQTQEIHTEANSGWIGGYRIPRSECELLWGSNAPSDAADVTNLARLGDAKNVRFVYVDCMRANLSSREAAQQQLTCEQSFPTFLMLSYANIPVVVFKVGVAPEALRERFGKVGNIVSYEETPSEAVTASGQDTSTWFKPFPTAEIKLVTASSKTTEASSTESVAPSVVAAVSEATTPDINVRMLLRRRLYLVEKAKTAQTIGILCGTLGVHGYLQTVNHLKKLVASTGRKPYLFSIGKINEPKICNFTDIDIFVLVACPFSVLHDSREYHIDIVSPFELEIALNGNRGWDGLYSMQFSDLLPGGALHIAFDDDDDGKDGNDDEGDGVVYSTVTRKLLHKTDYSSSSSAAVAPVEDVSRHGVGVMVTVGSTTLSIAHQDPVSAVHAKFQKRSFQGLVYNQPTGGDFQEKAAIVPVEQGLSGIARNYDIVHEAKQ